MHVSYAELIRGGTEAIRMTGYPFGQADDALEGFVWIQCATGRGYDLLRMADRLRPAGGWPKHKVCTPRPGATRVQLPGSPLLGVAARIADVARADGASGAAGAVALVEAHGGIGGWVAPYIAFRLARDGFHAAVLWLPGCPTIDGEAPASLIGAAALTDARVPLLVIPSTPYGITAGGSSSLPSALVQELVHALGQRSPRSLLLVVATRAAASARLLDPETACALLRCPELSGTEVGVLDGAGVLHRAVERGIDVEPMDHRLMIELGQRIRLPNTERSKSQAG